MGDWDPGLYLRFADERTQPSIDLASRVRLESPLKIIDVGCGPGNSTQVLRRRWPKSGILGTDFSGAMIERAKRDFPDQSWEIRDASEFDAREEYDLVFSNATLQWIPNHEALVPHLFSGVKKGGALAAQIPMFRTMPVNVAIEAVAARSGWRDRMSGVSELFTYRDAAFYYDVLSALGAKIDMWETSYVHVLESAVALLDFVKGTALRPYRESLSSDDERSRFDGELLEELARRYPPRPDGKLLFPFARLFFVAYKAER
jgi:trans-aconitate 2-methyltransferase